MNSVATDLRHAIRQYGKAPLASGVAVGVLATALTAFVAFLSLYISATKAHPGFEQAGQLATLAIIDDNPGSFGLPYGVVESMSADMSSITAAAISGSRTTLVGSQREETVTGLVSRNFFGGLRARLALGRGFTIEDHSPGAETVVVLSHDYWQQRFGGDPGVLGTTFEIARDPGQPYGSPIDPGEPEQESAEFRVIGVMAESLTGLAYAEPAIWLPLERVFTLFLGPARALPRESGRTFVRLREGVGTAAVINEIEARYVSTNDLRFREDDRIGAIEGIVRDIHTQKETLRQLRVFLAGSALLALVAAANVSLFLLARASGRQRELGIRMAVGASPKRLARQLTTEASALVVVAGVLGLLLSIWFSALLRNTAIFQDSEWRDATLFDGRVMVAAACAILVVALLSSLAPVLDLKRRGIAASSRSLAARATPAQRLVCTTQIAAAGIFSGAAIAFGWFVFPMLYGNPGYEAADRYVVQGAGEVYGRQGLAEVVLPRRREVIEAIPGVTGIGFGAPVPTWGFDYLVPVSIANPADPMNPIAVRRGVADPEFVNLLNLRVIAGSPPEVSDATGALVNQSLARLLWDRDDVVGEVLPTIDGAEEYPLTVTGVLEDLSFAHPAAPVPPTLFVSPSSPFTHHRLVSIVETQLTGAELRRELDRVAEAGQIEISLRGDIESLQQLRDELIAPDRTRGILTIGTAALVVALAALGLYGTQRYLVAVARREFAIRASVGAGPGSLERLVYRRALLLGAPGLVLGSLLAFIAVAWLRDDFLSREIAPAAVTTAVALGLALLLVGASIGPARQVRRDPPAPLLSED